IPNASVFYLLSLATDRVIVLPRGPFWRSARNLSDLELDLDVDARGEVQLHQCIHRLRGGIDDVEQPLVGPDLELLARLLVDVRRTVHGKLLDPRRQRDGAANLGARTLRRVDDL